jgi:hypothetical protein
MTTSSYYIKWGLHTPLLVRKDAWRRALEIEERHGSPLHPRTIAANIAGLRGERAPVSDVKRPGMPRFLYASSANATWQRSDLGKWIRATYREPSRWE